MTMFNSKYSQTCRHRNVCNLIIDVFLEGAAITSLQARHVLEKTDASIFRDEEEGSFSLMTYGLGSSKTLARMYQTVRHHMSGGRRLKTLVCADIG